MKSKTLSTVLAIAIALTFFLPSWSSGQDKQTSAELSAAQDPSQTQVNSRQTMPPSEILADKIIVGLVSEKQFLKMNLSFEEVVEVFKYIRDKRGWTIDDENLASALSWYKLGAKAPGSVPIETVTPYATGPCNDWIESESGSAYAAYPVYRTSPTPGECGPDADDVVLVYNTPKWPNTNSYSVRVSSSLWWVRTAIRDCYGGVTAKGLCTNTTRACVGSCAKWLGNDLNYLYLWHK